MRYENKIVKAIFIDRPNRFIAHVKVDGAVVTVHVKNTGRCKELLVPGCIVYLEKSANPERKTPYDLIAVEKENALQGGQTVLINMDSQAPNKVAREWILSNKERFPKITLLKPECTHGNSRFDFYVEYRDSCGEAKRMFLEVKGCTLEKGGHALFPDAPTERGVKHVRELAALARSGEFECGILVLIQMKGCFAFSPNSETHEDFAVALKDAQKAGVEIFAVDCNVTPETLEADAGVRVILP